MTDENIQDSSQGFSPHSTWIDVSVPLHNAMVHWPGDPALRIERVLDLEHGDSHTLSQISMGSHTGTHIDAPLHFVRKGAGIDVIRMDGNVITIIVNRAATRVLLETGSESLERMVFEPGTTMFDILLEAAREFLRRKSYNRFTGTELFAIAQEKYPDLKKRSFMSRLTAATPNHPSYKYHLSQRDYFSRIATGIYSLENQYLPKKTPHDVDLFDAESSGEKIR